MSNNKDTSFIEYNVEQPTQDFVTNFDTIGGTTDVVLVTVDGVLTDEPESAYTAQQINLNTWRITPEVPVGSVVRLYRVTDINEMMHVFTAGAKFIARNMDNNFKQIRHAQQEVRDDFSKLEVDTDVRLGAFSDRVDALNTEFLTTQDVVADLVTTSATTVSTANNALDTANAVDAKASTALSNSSTALNTANSIDVKATTALSNSSTALSVANGIDAKATSALSTANSAASTANTADANVNTALSTANTALSTANSIDAKATQAQQDASTALSTVTTQKGAANGIAPLDANVKIDPIYLPNATETVAGKAKIATTAIAQAGVNDTDFITAKKLRDALNASGEAPISACRAWVCFNGSTLEILNSLNILSITKIATGRFKLTFKVPMPTANFAVAGSNKQAYTSSYGSVVAIDPSDTGVASEVVISTKFGGAAEHYDYIKTMVGVFC